MSKFSAMRDLFKPDTEWPRPLPYVVVVSITVSILWGFGTVVSALIYITSVTGDYSRLAALAAILGYSGAAFGAGMIFGTLFGIPRSVEVPRAGGAQPSYKSNTALEQISDWLTKIIIGLGLTQFSSGLQAAARLVDTVAANIGAGKPSVAYAASTLIVSAIVGFLISYLINRTVLPYVFEASDRSRVAKVASESSAGGGTSAGGTSAGGTNAGGTNAGGTNAGGTADGAD